MEEKLAHSLKNPVLIVLRGPPASGKTTLAHSLVGRVDNCVQINIDMLWSMLGFLKYDGSKDRAHDSALYMAKEALKIGQSVILSEMFNRKEWLDNAKKLSQDLGVAFVVFSLSVDIDTYQYRIQTRNKSDLKTKSFEYIKDLYDRASSVEYSGSVNLDTSFIDLNEATDQIINYLLEHDK